MPLILGIVLMLSLGTVMLVQNTFQQFPIVTKDVIQHQAYRAMLSGLNEYLYAVNSNPNFAACSSSFVNGAGTTLGTANLPAGICSQLSFGTWTSVPGSGAANGAPSWFLVDNPKLSTATGNLTVNIVGAAGYPGTYNYQSAAITLKPLNSFLLNVLWINFNQVDPAVVAQYNGNGTPSCTWYWSPGDRDQLGNGCENVDFISGDSLTGNLFVNDSIWICGTPTFQNVQTADPDEQWDDDGCGQSPTVTGTWTDNVPVQPIPSDNSNLEVQAAQNGCVFQGPTTIVLNGTTMTVTSPGTPTGKPAGAPGGSSSNDPLNDPANTANVCVPSNPVTGGSVNLPSNGVIYVENCQAAYTANGKCNGSNANPLSAAGETGVGGPTIGDAIIQGSITTPTIVGSANNIVIDGNLCYTDALSSGHCTTSAPASPSTNILGLVALNYVEVNHPVDGNGNNVSSCSPSNSTSSGAVNCDLSSPTIDAVILALNHSFLVNNYDTGNALGTITLNGTIDEDWRGPVGTSSGGSIHTGYAKNYQYDPRLIYLSPPYYLSPGTSQWGFASFTVVSGQCKLLAGSPNTAQCTGYP